MFRIVLESVGRFVRSMFAALDAARLVSDAIESRRAPSAAALRTLGIDPDLYRGIRVL